MTCRRAKSWLDSQGVEYDYRNIVKEPLTAEELTQLAELANRPVIEIVNTRSPSYRRLKEKPTEAQQAIDLIRGNPKVMIRPALATAKGATFGFDKDAFQELVTE